MQVPAEYRVDYNSVFPSYNLFIRSGQLMLSYYSFLRKMTPFAFSYSPHQQIILQDICTFALYMYMYIIIAHENVLIHRMQCIHTVLEV